MQDGEPLACLATRRIFSNKKVPDCGTLLRMWVKGMFGLKGAKLVRERRLKEKTAIFRVPSAFSTKRRE
jgi:hypothetical protein